MPPANPAPYLAAEAVSGSGRRVFIETYGCQMNVADTEVVRSLMQDAGYTRAEQLAEADVVLINTCAIRDGAEKKVWNRLREVNSVIGRRTAAARRNPGSAPLVGLLGCMAERLKGRLLEQDQLVDVVCGPDAYRELPRLLSQATSGQAAIDVRLSLEETYADIAPVREAAGGVSAFVSIMRGCNNMCSYCIVPFTRGRERSRDPDSIASEVDQLVTSGVREVTLLGQNVNSYAFDTTQQGRRAGEPPPPLRDGFSSKVPPPRGDLRFAGLIERLAIAHPEVRFRFTSPHPKDFPDDLLTTIRDHPNVCEALHLPAQSGSSAVLSAMKRDYTREAYLALIERVRELLPRASISSDFISGFCGETEEDHQQTLSLLRAVRYEKAYMFAYSMREKTHAHRNLVDDVPQATKQRRLQEVINTYNEGARRSNLEEVGRTHLVLVDGLSKKSEAEWAGRTDSNKRVVFARRPVPASAAASAEVELRVGDYVAVRVTEGISANTLRAEPLARSSIAEFYGGWGSRRSADAPPGSPSSTWPAFMRARESADGPSSA